MRAFAERGTRSVENIVGVEGHYHAYAAEACPFDMLIDRP
jgi:hypothetical protein